MKLLVTGNIGYITTEFIEEAFPECQILLLGETEQKSNRNKRLSVYPMPKTEEEFKDIFKTYEFEGVIYFSNYLTFHGTMEGEIETLRKLLHYYKGNLNSRLLYITGPDSLYEDTTGKTLMVRSAEEFCRQYGELHQIAVKILRVPYLYSGTYEEDYFFKLFSTVINKKQITFEEAPAQEMHFLALSDLGDLLYKIFDNWGEGSACLQVPQVFHFTFQQFGERLAQMFPAANITYLSEVLIRDGISDDHVLRNEYGWFPKISLLEELTDIYEDYCEKTNHKTRKIDVVKTFLKVHDKIVKIAELLLTFLVFEALNRVAGNQVQFQMIDLRLVYIVLFSSLYGINYGLAAAGLETLSLLAAYTKTGIGWTTLFYEPSNWIPFIFYFAVGAICGYIRLKNRDNIQFMKEENKLILDKFLFMREMYQETLSDKRQYKKQILGSRDSFGKIFDITKKLDIILPQELFIETLHVMESVLENHTFAIYSVGKNQSYGRLEIASQGMTDVLKKSICLDDYLEAKETIVSGKVWVNRNFLDGYPMYMNGIHKDGELVMLIFIQEVGNEQLSLYYLNLFQILCGLVETALLRALEYQEAIKNRQYVQGTRILKQEYFEERLYSFHSMREENRASYVLLKLEYPKMTLEEADTALQASVRENDVRGISEKGELLTLLYRYFPQREISAFFFLRWVDQFLPLAFTGLFTNIGLFAHLVIMWCGPIRVHVQGLFYGAPYHDVPAMIAYLTILITTVNFVVSVEVNFYPKYRNYYSLFNDKGEIKDILQAGNEMRKVLNMELKYTALKQLLTTALAISIGQLLLTYLPLGFNDLMEGYFRTLCVGYGLYAIANTMMLILLYFTDYKGALFATGMFATCTTTFTCVSLFFPQVYYGFGFLLGSAVFFLICTLRLGYFIKKLPYYILSVQPIVAEDKTGFFTRLGCFLEEKIERGDKLEKI